MRCALIGKTPKRHLSDNEIDNDQVSVEHEARVSKVAEEQLFYLQSRGLTEDAARLLIVNGFMEPFTKKLPLNTQLFQPPDPA